MADSHDIGLIAHLMRRAGFGASREELEMRAAKGYNATVEELLNPESPEPPEQIDMFREKGMGNYRELLVALAKNPAMIYWLDNQENHKRAVNENWGRELLELFSMGQGNYTEKDVREASRAFTGWGIAAKIPRLPYGRFPWEFEYNPEDHDD